MSGFAPELKRVEVDASFREGVAGIAGVFHFRGDTRVLFAKIVYPRDSISAERMALATACDRADRNDWSEVQFTTDCQNLHKFVQSHYGHRLDWSLRITGRANNGAAHRIARATLRIHWRGYGKDVPRLLEEHKAASVGGYRKVLPVLEQYLDGRLQDGT